MIAVEAGRKRPHSPQAKPQKPESTKRGSAAPPEESTPESDADQDLTDEEADSSRPDPSFQDDAAEAPGPDVSPYD